MKERPINPYRQIGRGKYRGLEKQKKKKKPPNNNNKTKQKQKAAEQEGQVEKDTKTRSLAHCFTSLAHTRWLVAGNSKKSDDVVEERDFSLGGQHFPF